MDNVAVRAIANLWGFNAALIGRLAQVLVESGVVPSDTIERMLQELDVDLEALEGADDQDYATQLLAHVRAVVRASGKAPDRGGG